MELSKHSAWPQSHVKFITLYLTFSVSGLFISVAKAIFWIAIHTKSASAVDFYSSQLLLVFPSVIPRVMENKLLRINFVFGLNFNTQSEVSQLIREVTTLTIELPDYLAIVTIQFSLYINGRKCKWKRIENCRR